jgi:hypothetical protein
LTYKVAKIEGLSLFCDWKDVDAPENGGIDLAVLQRQAEAKRVADTGMSTYFEEIIEREFTDDPSKFIKHKNLI